MNQGGWKCELPTLVSSDSEIPASSRLGSRWNRCSRTRSCCGIVSQGFTEVNIAFTYDWEHLFPWGSHPKLDPLWSNGKVLLSHDGCEATRLDKTRLVSEHPIALETLRVCLRESRLAL